MAEPILEVKGLKTYFYTEEGVLPGRYDFEAHRELVPMQPGDVAVTYADTSELERDFGYRPSMRLEDGLREFARWYKRYYRL